MPVPHSHFDIKVTRNLYNQTKCLWLRTSSVLVTDGVINFTAPQPWQWLVSSLYEHIFWLSLLIIKELHHRMYFITYVVNQLIYREKTFGFSHVRQKFIYVYSFSYSF